METATLTLNIKFGNQNLKLDMAESMRNFSSSSPNDFIYRLNFIPNYSSRYFTRLKK
jgi:hypothetical protein